MQCNSHYGDPPQKNSPPHSEKPLNSVGVGALGSSCLFPRMLGRDPQCLFFLRPDDHTCWFVEIVVPSGILNTRGPRTRPFKTEKDQDHKFDVNLPPPHPQTQKGVLVAGNVLHFSLGRACAWCSSCSR